MSRFLLDTNILSSLINDRGRSPVLSRVAEVDPKRICTSIIVAAEIRYGAARRSSQRLEDSVERVLRSVEIIPFDHPAQIAYGTLRADLEQRGLIIGPNDLLIAAQCLALGFTLVTNNTREFTRVEGLRLTDWSA